MLKYGQDDTKGTVLVCHDSQVHLTPPLAGVTKVQGQIEVMVKLMFFRPSPQLDHHIMLCSE